MAQKGSLIDLKGLREGGYLYFRSETFRVASIPADGVSIEAENLSTGEIIRIPLLDLFGKDEAGGITAFGAPTLEKLQEQILVYQPIQQIANEAGLPDHFLREAERIIRTVEAVDKAMTEAERQALLRDKTPLRTKRLRVILKTLDKPVSVTTYYHYRKLFRQYEGNRAAIAESLRRSTLDKIRVDMATLHLIDTCIHQYYDRPEPIRPSKFLTMIKELLQRTGNLWVDPTRCPSGVPKNLVADLLNTNIQIAPVLENPENRRLMVEVKLPSDRWFYGYLRWFEGHREEGQRVIQRRYGQAEWDKTYGVYDSYISKASTILQDVFADHWLFDMFVKDEDGKPIRLWLTLLIDAYSRCILGMALLYERPCIESVQTALRHAIWPKHSHTDVGVDSVTGDWACYGIPLHLHLDNAWAHHSHSVEELARAIGQGGRYNSMVLDFRPPYRGWYGAIIERLFGNFSDTLKQLFPSAIRSSDPKEVRRAASEAVYTFEDVYRLIHELILIYQHTPHSGLNGMTPHEKWMEGTKMGLPQVPQLTDEVERLFWRLHPDPRKITSKGISLFGLNYWSAALKDAPQRDKHGKRIEYRVRVDVDDISHIALFKEGQWLGDLHALKLRLPDGSPERVSLAERRLSQRAAKLAGQPATQWLAFRNRWHKKAEDRKKEARNRGKAAKAPPAPSVSSGQIDKMLSNLGETSDFADKYTELLKRYSKRLKGQ